ncbi:MAG: hypothetical protein O7149_01640 [Wolbachia endosymbiont of Hylaeus sinuatus]|nr:hypothetical protein [Wolbachia endosymbiont of Hylaeus sinuatus]
MLAGSAEIPWRYDVSLATYSLVIPVLLFLSSQRHALVSTLYHELSKIH